MVTFLSLDTNMPAENQKRLEKLLIMFDPDLDDQSYFTFCEGDKSFRQIVSGLKEKKRDNFLHLTSKPYLTITQKAERLKKYNLSEIAEILEIPRQTLYYWIKREWVKPKRDSKQYPFFTVFGNKVNLDKLNRRFTKNHRFLHPTLNHCRLN